MCFSVQIFRNLSELSRMFQAEIDKQRFLAFEREQRKNSHVFKGPDEDDRIFPNTFLPVVKWEENQRRILPMRYRLRPHDAKEEVPSKYNLFNARVDSLEARKTWRPLFGQNHGVIVLKRFYEWVSDAEGKKVLVSFKPKQDYMTVPVLYDFYESPVVSFYSCALITKDPPSEIERAGHDRCPIFIKEDLIDTWLQPQGKSKEEIYSLLNQPQDTTYTFDIVQEPNKNKESNRDQLDLFAESEKSSPISEK